MIVLINERLEKVVAVVNSSQLAHLSLKKRSTKPYALTSRRELNTACTFAASTWPNQSGHPARRNIKIKSVQHFQIRSTGVSEANIF